MLVRDFAATLNTTEDEVTQKMKSLRTYWLQRRGEYSKRKSGSSASTTPVWSFYKQLSFLEKSQTPRPTISNTTAGDETMIDMKVSTGNVNQSQPPRERTRQKWKNGEPSEHQQSQTQLLKTAIDILGKSTEETPPEKETSDQVFSKMILDSMASIPESLDKDGLKLELLQRILSHKQRYNTQ